MTWVKLDDAAPMHPKLLKLSDGALRLWIHGVAFANRAVTDGRIDKALVPSLNHHGRWSAKQLAAFVDELSVGLWIDCGDHFQIHDYAHHQAEALKDRVERKREYEREKKRKQREESDRKRYGIPVGVPTGQAEGHDGEVLREASVPTRPDPSRPFLSPVGESVRAPAREAKPSPGTDALLRSLTPTPDRDAQVIALITETRGTRFRPVSHTDRDAVSRLGEWASGMPGGMDDLRTVLTAFWSAKGKSASLRWLADEDPGRYLSEPAKATSRPGAWVSCPPASAFKGDDSELVAWERGLR